MVDLLLQGGTIVDGQCEAAGSLAIAGGRVVARFAPGAELPSARRTIDAAGRLIFPGVVDPHVHFYGEGIGEYSRLAAMGGVTTFIGMIRGAPEEPLARVVAAHRDAGLGQSAIDFSFHVVLYDRPDTLSQLQAMAGAGLRSFKMFLAYKRRGMMVSEAFLIAAMSEIRRLGGIALVHAEDGEVIDHLEQCAGATGRTSAEDYEPSRPAEAEAVSIGMVALCAEATGCPVYVVHLSSSAGLAAVERARRRGVPVWIETCPQYLLMDDTTLRRHGAIAKIAPPLRGAADRRALGTALLTGSINTIGSDHASHALEAKRAAGKDIFAAPFGMPGSPVLWPAMYSWAAENKVPLPILVRAMSETPARLFGLGHRKGHLQPGADADLIIVDPASRKRVDAEALWPKVAPNPLAGASLAGWPELTLSRGEVAWSGEEVTARPGRAQFIEQKG